MAPFDGEMLERLIGEVKPLVERDCPANMVLLMAFPLTPAARALG